jgi:hypothetical protein
MRRQAARSAKPGGGGGGRSRQAAGAREAAELTKARNILDDSQPVPTDAIYAQYARLGATGALVSRAFFGPDPLAVDVVAEVERCRRRMAHWRQCGADELEAARARLQALVGAGPRR